MQNKILKFKVIGDKSVGKTSIITQICDGIFNETQENESLISDFKIKYINIQDINYKIQLWDTTSSQKFISLCESTYRCVSGLLLLFDITNRQSFENFNIWHSEALRYTLTNTPIILVGNKLDIVDCDNTQRKVTYDEAKQLADNFGIKYFEVSSKNNIGTQECILELLNQGIQFDNNLKLNNLNIQNNNNNNNNYNNNKIDNNKSSKCILN